MVPKPSAKPSLYPALFFHIVRASQLVSSLVVAGIMGYFLRELYKDHYRLPWTFILLLATSLFTILTLAATYFLYMVHSLNPMTNAFINGFLTSLWAVSFALLTWWSSGTLGHVCSKRNWETGTGVMICQIYKTLFSFSLLGFQATAVALFLDIRTIKKERKKGKFTALEQRENTHAFDTGMGPDELNPNPTKRVMQAKRGGDGYALPEEQFAYDDDTSYHGAGGQVERRSLEERL